MCELMNWNSETILSLATVVLAIATIGLTILTNGMVKEMRKAREEDSRAYITADISYDDIRGFIDIRNIGKKTARNIVVKFSPDITPHLANHYRNRNPYDGLKTMPPGSHKRVEIKNKKDAWIKAGESPMPINFTITMSYECDGKNYPDEFPIDLTYDKFIANPNSGYEPPQNN